MNSIVKLRGTIFCVPIPFARDFVAEMSDALKDFTPLVIVNAMPVPPFFQTWQLNSPDNREALVFSGDKIDLFQNTEEMPSGEISNSFIDRCKIVFNKIMKLKNCKCSRMALAPTMAVEKPEKLYERLFKILEFQDAKLDSSNLSQVYHMKKNLLGKEILFNYVVNFRNDTSIVQNAGREQLREKFIADFDINTKQDPQYRFDDSMLNKFFDVAAACFKDFYELYMGEGVEK